MWFSYKLDIRLEAVHINPNVYVVLSKGVHATRVVRRRVYVVDSNRVGSKLFHEGGVELALRGVRERIVFDQLVGNAYVEQTC
jgi:hypothetical protein